MPNHVGNSIVVRGPDEEIDRLLATCFHLLDPEEDGDDEGLQFNFRAVIPVDDSSIEAFIRHPDMNVLRRQAWGTKWNAYDGAIVSRDPGCLNFEFNTAWDFPEPVYRKLGKMFPQLSFDIAAIDPGEWWAVTAIIAGGKAVFDRKADCKTVYERVYKESFEAALQPDT